MKIKQLTMNNGQRTKIKKMMDIPFFFFLFSLIFFSGCQNIFAPPNGIKSAGQGYFSLSIGEQGSGRTIMPTTVQDDFVAFTFEFFVPNASTPAFPAVVRTKANLSDPITLAGGTWKVLVTAYMEVGRTKPVAQGILSGVVIEAGETTIETITLVPIADSGEGTFDYTIGYPINVTAAAMTITRLPITPQTELAAQTISLLGGSPKTGSVTLGSGYCRVVFQLTNNEGLAAERWETLHVYQNMVSEFAFTFEEDQFHAALTGTVSIEGTAAVGQTLTAVTTALEGSGGISYQWYRGGIEIPGANDDSYTVQAADVGSTITVTVTRTGYSGSATSLPTAVIPAPIGSGQYAGKDVLGNSYSLSVGSDASRAAIRNDRYRMEVRTRDGRTRSVTGIVTDISTDGTLTLEPDGSTDEFTATVGGNTLESVASGGDLAPIPFSDGTTLTPRTFDNIHLRATRWSGGGARGENWGSGLSVLVKDFPTNVSRLTWDNDRYAMTVSGTVDTNLSRVEFEVQGLTEDDQWEYLAGYTDGDIQITANVPFNITKNLNVAVNADLTSYKEIILQVTNDILKVFDDHPEWNVDNGTIPAEIPNGQIMASISNFNISLKDNLKEALAGNVGDYTFGFQEDGLSVDYRQAVLSLTPENIALAKQARAKLEFTMLDVPDIYAGGGTALDFVWQDPERELWWQDQTFVSGWDGDISAPKLGDVASWDPYRKKVTIDLSTAISDNRFATSNKLNFIIGCWWNNGQACPNIDELGIAGVNILVSPPPSDGNMGNWSYGYKEDGISPEYNQAVWHLDYDTLATAKEAGSQLEIVFSEDLDDINPSLALVWQGIDTQRWWSEVSSANLVIRAWDVTDKAGVTYDPSEKKLTVVLYQALETYSGFMDAADVNLVLPCWWGITDKIDELGIVSADIVAGTLPSSIVVDNPAFSSSWGDTATVEEDGWVTWAGDGALIAWEFPSRWDLYSTITVTYEVRNVDTDIGSDAPQLVIKRVKKGEMYTLLDPNYGTITDTDGNNPYPWLDESGGTLVIDRAEADFDGCIGFQFNHEGYGYDIKITKVEFHN
jgi:hypothetical protein